MSPTLNVPPLKTVVSGAGLQSSLRSVGVPLSSRTESTLTGVADVVVTR